MTVQELLWTCGHFHKKLQKTCTYYYTSIRSHTGAHTTVNIIQMEPWSTGLVLPFYWSSLPSVR